jgi:hypothetical protein
MNETGWDAEQANVAEIELLESMVRDRDWTTDETPGNRQWVIEEYAKGFHKLTRAEVTDLANYFRRFKRHKLTPVERRTHLRNVFGAEGVTYKP